MKIKIRKAAERGVAEHGWLHARFSFSFAGYYDPAHCGFHALQVMNNDRIEPQSGFPMHPHQNAEIFTYILSGQLEHKDSMGNAGVIHDNEIQVMSAGTGIFHSEYNKNKDISIIKTINSEKNILSIEKIYFDDNKI